MMRSRVTLASTEAAATDEHLRSALIIVVTGGVDGVLVGEREQPDVLGGGEPVVVAVEDDEVGRCRTPTWRAPGSRPGAAPR